MMERTGSKLTDLTDAQLVALALEGESQAPYFALYARYHTGVRTHVARFAASREDIEDICMESFEKAFKQLGTYRPEMRFSTWMLTIARNTALDHRDKALVRGKKLETTPFEIAENEASSVADDTRSPEDQIIDTQLHEKFLVSIDGLPDLYREPARLCFIDNLGYREIAEKTGLPINTVKTRIRRAKDQLTAIMLSSDED